MNALLGGMKNVFVIILLGFLCIGGWYLFAIRPVDPDDGSRSITIESGSTTESIAATLQEANLIRSPFVFRIYTRLSGRDGKLQAGMFAVSRSMSLPELVGQLHTGKGEQAVITIPEGFTVQDIDTLLAERGFAEVGEVIRCLRECDFSSFEFLPKEGDLAIRGGQLEGYLFPETYYIEPENFVTKFFLERLLTTFRKRILEGLSGEIIASERSLHEIVTMASLIEEETRTDDERRVVSDILWKRFDDNKGLGVDATVRYILGKPTDAITYADLNTNSPYNTRKFRGLPPGPIASPGMKSIRAALHPKASPYWYYLHDPEGNIHYARTNQEHNVNRYMYLQK